MKCYRLPLDLRRKRNVIECSQGEKVRLTYDYVTLFENKIGGLALLKDRETALTTYAEAEQSGK